MELNFFCENCDKNVEYIIKKIPMIIMINEEPISVEGYKAYCKNCGNELYNKMLYSKNLLDGYNVYREKHNLIAPERIKLLRTQYNLDYLTMSKIIDIDERLIRSYEAGMLPTPEMSKYFESLEDKKVFQAALEKNKNFLTEDEYDLVLMIINPELKERLQNEKIVRDVKSVQENIDIENFQRLVSLISKLSIEMPAPKFAKILWVCDKYYFNTYRKLFTKMEYVKLDFGPCPIKLYNVLQFLEKKDLIKIKDNNRMGETNLTKISISFREKDLEKYIPEKDRGAFRNLIKKYNDLGNDAFNNIINKLEELKTIKTNQKITFAAGGDV